MKMLKKLLVFTLILNIFISNAFAQAASDTDLTQESMQDFYIVAGMGVGGAILGLSTISFKGDPNIGDNMHRVQTGTAIGIIIGVFVVAANQAERSTKIFGPGEGADQGAFNISPKDFDTTMRTSWHFESLPSLNDAPMQISHSWNF